MSTHSRLMDAAVEAEESFREYERESARVAKLFLERLRAETDWPAEQLVLTPESTATLRRRAFDDLGGFDGEGRRCLTLYAKLGDGFETKLDLKVYREERRWLIQLAGQRPVEFDFQNVDELESQFEASVRASLERLNFAPRWL